MIEYTKADKSGMDNGHSLQVGTEYYIYDEQVKKCLVEKMGRQTEKFYPYPPSEIPKMIKAMEALGLDNIRIVQHYEGDVFGCIGYNNA